MRALITAILLCISVTVRADVNAVDYGFIPDDPTYDNTVKLDSFVQSDPDDTILYFPKGSYYFNSQPQIIDKGITIRGGGTNVTTFVRNYVPSSYSDNLLHFTRTAVVKNIAILAKTQGGGAIKLEGLPASSSVLRDLYITAMTGGNYAIPLTLASSHRLGIRGITIDNVELFAATIHGAWFQNVRGLTANFQYYPAGGVVSHVVIQGSAGYRSSSIKINTRHLPFIYFYATDGAKINTLNTAVSQSGSTGITTQ